MGDLSTIQIVWIIIFVLSLGVEIATLGITSIWFTIGSLAAFLASLASLPTSAQVIIFVFVSLILLFFTRPIVVKFLKVGKNKTNYEGVIGKSCLATEDINNYKLSGKVQFNGQYWTARSESDSVVIKRGTLVEIVAIQGVKVIVKEKNLKEKSEKTEK